MSFGIVGKKIGMTQIFDDAGLAVPITVIDTAGCQITQKKTKETDGYAALQVGFGTRKQQNITKARAGLFKQAGTGPKACVREIRVNSEEHIAHLKPGETLKPTLFAKGDLVDVTGVTKGRGFQGVVKRHGYHGGDATHGVSDYFRHGGSIGTNTWPGKVLKNKGMPGHMGNVPRTVQNVEVVEVRAKENLIFLRGAVPGARNGVVLVRSAKKSPIGDKRSWT